MKVEIIYTDDYALIVSDEKIVEGSFIYETNIGEVSKVDKWYCEILEKGAKVEPFVKVIAHRPLTDSPILEGVPLIPPFSRCQEDGAENAVMEFKKVYGPLGATDYELSAFSKGYNKAKETYKYTEEDLRKAIEMAITSKYEYKLEFYNQNEIIQSLQQPKRPKYFECEMELLPCNESFGLDYGSFNLELKTITNSQNQTELIGTYYYE
jgi:hypothetical protein